MGIKGERSTESSLPDRPIRLVVADPHAVVLKALEALLAQQPDFAVVAACSTGQATLDAVRTLRPHVIVLDIRMPGQGGLRLVRLLKTERNAPCVVLLAAFIEEDEVQEATRLGVAGIVLKEMTPDLLFDCIRTVHAGKRWVERGETVRKRLSARQADARRLAQVLTRRELQIVRLVGQGVSFRETARRLGLSESTVKTHLHHVYTKLHLDGRVALMLFARERGLI